MGMKVTFRGKEIRNPVLRSVVTAFVFFVAGFALLALVVLSPLLALLHFLLRLAGRNGFIQEHPDGKISIRITLWSLRSLEEHHS